MPPFKARRFDTRDGDRDLTLDELRALEIDDDQLLWVDLQSIEGETCRDVWRALRLPAAAARFAEKGTTPAIVTEGEFFWLRVVAASDDADPQLGGAVLTIVAGRNRVVSLHTETLAFLECIRQRESASPAIARLSAESFVAALLDAHLATYFDAVADYEKAIEALENNILDQKTLSTLPQLRRMRRWASRLRRMLAPHRTVFSTLSRPDFAASDSAAAAQHFAAIDTRFERAMDMVENARDLVLGSFDLFSSQTALQTNESMKILTFATVITGALATVVGVLGMNFDAEFFKTQDAGFWVAIAGLVALTVAALAVGRWRQWY